MSDYDLGEPSLEPVGWIIHSGSDAPPEAEPRRPPIVSPQDLEALAAFRRAGWHWLGRRLKHLEPGQLGFLVRRKSSDPAEDADRVEKAGTLAILHRRLVVQLRPRLEPEDVTRYLGDKGLRLIRPLRFAPNLFEAEARADAVPHLPRDMAALLKTLNGDKSHVVYAEYAFLEHLAGRANGDDPFLGAQWQWARIGALGVWPVNRAEDQTIGVIDLGFQVQHEDLKPNLDRGRSAYFDGNQDLIPGVNGIVALPHGTQCAGMAGARLGNAKGGAGAAPNARLMLVGLHPHEVGSQVLVARAVAYCAKPGGETPGADVISCSLGPSSTSWVLTTTLALAIDYAVSQGRAHAGPELGCPVFWATANRDHEIPDDSVAGYANVIAVAASDSNDQRARGGHGARLAFLAPGVGVTTTNVGNSYCAPKGASFAAPCAAGVAALVLQKHSRLKWSEVRDHMIATGRRLQIPGFGNPVRIDAAAAVNEPV